jgi:hypothetical protein
MGMTTSAWAFNPEHAAANCKHTTATSSFNGTLGINAQNQLYDAGSGDNGVQAICPLSNAPFTSVSVSGFAAGVNTIKAQMCYQPSTGGSPVCGSIAGSTAAGFQSISVPTPSGSTSSDFFFLLIDMFDSGGTVWGYMD